MSTTTLKIEDLVQWSQPKSIHTKQGPRRLRTAEPTDLFWRAWKASKETLKQAGVSVGKDPRSGVWQACWWLSDEQAEERIEASRATDAAVEIPCPEGLAYMPFQRAGIAYAIAKLGDL